MKKRANDSEGLVEWTLEEHRDRVSGIRHKKHSESDTNGKDFTITAFEGRSTEVMLQVKTSDNGETIGLVLPLDKSSLNGNGRRISARMYERITRHIRMHPQVRYFLFVSQPCKHHDEHSIRTQIWRELQKLLQYAVNDRHS